MTTPSLDAGALMDADSPRPAGPIRRFATSSSFWLIIMLVVLIVVFSLISPEAFPTARNLRNIAYDASGLLLISIGMTYVIITGGIDLSPGAVLVFSQIISAQVVVYQGLQGLTAIVVGILVALAIAAVWGTVNGLLIAYAGVPPLVATLGTLGMAGGGALILTNGLNIAAFPPALTDFGSAVWLGIPLAIWLVAVITVIAAVVLANTRFGRYTYAIGSSRVAAERSGIDVRRHLASVYVLSGVLAGLAGFLEMARFGSTSVIGHSTDALNSIAAVVIGGTSLFGGIGTILGTVIGVFIPATLRNGFLIVGMGAFWQQAAIGLLLVVAVYWDQRKRRRRKGF